MKKILLIVSLVLASNFVNAQTTAIPDANFENQLIQLSLDIILDGSVLTANIDTLTYLQVSSQNISDMTGIENFTALRTLICDNNQLTNLNITQNLNLQTLWCNQNQLTSLDISQNILLNSIDCWYNQITSLDVTQNPNLVSLKCYFNQITSVDLTQNPLLTFLYCNNNLLTELDVSQNSTLSSIGCSSNLLNCLNVKSGFNQTLSDFHTINNPNLTCIEVDDSTWSANNWTGSWPNIDPWTYFSENCYNTCSPVSIEENTLSQLSIYPNPTAGLINIDLEETKSNIDLLLKNALGQVVLTINYKSTNHINLDLDTPRGLYYLRLECEGEVITKKIIKE